MSYSNNYSWGTQNSNSNNKKQDAPLNVKNWQQLGAGNQVSWNQQHVPLAPQSVYPEQQQNWNNNYYQKPPPSHSSQMNYNAEKNYSWNHPVQQSESYQNQQNPQQYQVQPGISQQYSFNNSVNVSNPPYYNIEQQMNYQQGNVNSPDPWNWGWDESSNNSPATSANNNISNDSRNKWNTSENVQETFNPIQNYFQQGSNFTQMMPPEQEMNLNTVENYRNEPLLQQNIASAPVEVQQDFYENDEKLSFNTEKNNEILNVKQDVKNEFLNNPMSPGNMNNLNFREGEMNSNFDIKSEETQSFCSNNSLSNNSELKTERLSPDSCKTPLTTQALRDFCNEKYENGPMDSKLFRNSEALTPQWSVESQVSQDTASDDISSSLQEGCASDLSAWDSTSGHHQTNDNTMDNSVNNSPGSTFQNKDVSTIKQPQVPQNQEGSHMGGNSFFVKTEENFIAEERPNQQVIVSDSLPPTTTIPRTTDESGKNPYALKKKFSHKGSNLNNNFNSSEPTNLVKQMDACTLSSDNSVNSSFSGNGSVNDRKNDSNVSYQPDQHIAKRDDVGDETVNQETIPDNEERPDVEEHKKPGFKPVVKYPPKNSKTSSLSRSHKPLPVGSDNQEMTSRPDRNQYLETGQLEDQLQTDYTYNDIELASESMPPPGLSRHVPESNIENNPQNNALNISSPPPGLDRMVLGQITENESQVASESNSRRANQNTPPPGLHRMVPGQLNDDQEQCSIEESSNVLPNNSRRSDVPPPGLRRMIPGESSSPESQNNIQMSMEPRVQRVVTGVAKDEISINPIQTNMPSSSPTPESENP
ncbi:conserved hypothetical protein [Pediculus humanus corporis]|uniref:Uncharacterized protein n=1 Tax=Pediculus humanus subsp. corporis TaxID=121224 RepID=E0VLX0_PEDHC|nr:uncharacterized protein Phum_PHUM296340 [Pediculus humanus corporis]EEB14376.1 conserved hypothetical protein [Pediculus humanus corporis]